MGEHVNDDRPRRADAACDWCGLRLAAVPDAPVQWDGMWYHRTGCLDAARLKAGGYLPADYEPWALPMRGAATK